VAEAGKVGICLIDIPGEATIENIGQMRILDSVQLHMSSKVQKTTIEIPSAAITIDLENSSDIGLLAIEASDEYCYKGNTPTSVIVKLKDGGNISSSCVGLLMVLFNPNLNTGQALGLYNTFDSINSDSDSGFIIDSDSITMPFDSDSSSFISEIGSSGFYIVLVESVDETTGEFVCANTVNTWESLKLNLPTFETDGEHVVELELSNDSYYGGLSMVNK
jgi:hypothetical protein